MVYMFAGQDMGDVRTGLDVVLFELQGVLIQFMSIVDGWSVKEGPRVAGRSNSGIGSIGDGWKSEEVFGRVVGWDGTMTSWQWGAKAGLG